MSGYSYSEIQNMQQKAMERVREMKRTSDEITRVAQKDFEIDRKKVNYDNDKSSVTPKVTNMPPNYPPPNYPENSVYPSFKDFFSTQQEIKQQKQKLLKQENKPMETAITNLFNEPDKALLLGLIMLLKSEKADESLIMALTYIMS